MTHRQLITVFGLCVAGLIFATTAEAIIVHYFPILSIVNGVQTARINAVLVAPPDPDLPCPVSLVFTDSHGRFIGDPTLFELRGGAAVGVDFVGDPNLRGGERLQIRAAVTISDPGEFPGCAAGVLTSVEVVDRLTRATHIILTNPVERALR